MAIYDLSKVVTRGACAAPLWEEEISVEPEKEAPPERGSLFSACAARLFFLILLVADLIWMGVSLSILLITSLQVACTGGQHKAWRTKQLKYWVAVRRSLVCAVALCLALFSPSFGIMVACTYFFMYDQTGIDEVVPSSLRSQFKAMMPRS